MSLSSLRRPLCINRRIAASSLLSIQSCRNRSTLSAIKQGLRTTRDEGRSERGGRDRSSRPQSSKGSDYPLKRQLERTDSNRDQRFAARTRKFDSDRPRQREDRSFSSRSRDDSGPSRRGGFGEKGFSSRQREDSGPPRRSAFGERGEKRDFSRSKDNSQAQRRSSFGEDSEKKFRSRDDSSFPSRSRDDLEPRRRSSFGDGSEKKFRSRDDSGPPRRGSFGERGEKGFSSRSRDDSGTPRRETFGDRGDKSFSSRSRDAPERPRSEKSWFSSPKADSAPSTRGDGGEGGGNGFTARSRETAESRPRTKTDDETGESESTTNGPTGVFRVIKNACKLVKTIQERQVTGEGVEGLISDTKAALERINSFVASGNFQRDEPGDAIAALLKKKAADGTFTTDLRRGESATVIFQKPDGTLGLALGRGGPVRPSRPSRDDDKDVERWRPNSTQERSSKFDKSSEKFSSRQNRDEIDDERDEIPVSVPYTTAASEFLYGYNSVLAALRAQRRKIYKLYIHPKMFEREHGRDSRDSQEMPGHEFVSLAKAAKIPFQNEFNTRILDKMSDGRPHNGLVLEVSKLPAPPVVSLGKPNMKQSIIPLTLARQTAEEAAVNGSPTSIPIPAKSWRYPLVVLLDGITDPGNVGNILRTCHFYGVDAVAVAVNTCSNLSSAVLAKASSGACEAAPILAISQPSNFIFDSSKSRWKVFAAVAPTAGTSQGTPHLTTAALMADSPLAKHPCILMLGAEGEGLRENLKNRADHFVSIAGGRRAEDMVDVGVDSMNVSVAAGVLLESFLRKPEAAPLVLEAAAELGF